MRILSWNMAGGFGYDAVQHERAWRYLRDSDPDVALLQEAVPPAWADERWPFVLRSRRYPDSDVPWGTAIVGRVEASVATVGDDFPWLRSLWGAVSAARLEGPQPLWLASIHSSAYPLEGEDRVSIPADTPRCDPKQVWEIEVLAPELSRLFGGGPFVAGGDLNSSLLFDQRENKTSNAKLFANLAAAGFVDLRPRFSPGEQQTYFKPGKPPSQLDHLFADGETAGNATSWRVLRDVAETAALSDHAPIEVVLDIEKQVAE
jgi:endonuclease/exonuclease/phosphatase family metal-dependent hydrolase